eukprot:jgi/Mesvir1/26109/Mv06826-RA.1
MTAEASEVRIRLTEKDSQEELLQISAAATRKKSAKEKACRYALGVVTGCKDIDAIPEIGGFRKEEDPKLWAGRFEVTMRIISKQICKPSQPALDDAVVSQCHIHEVKGVGESKKKAVQDAAQRVIKNMAQRLKLAQAPNAVPVGTPSLASLAQNVVTAVAAAPKETAAGPLLTPTTMQPTQPQHHQPPALKGGEEKKMERLCERPVTPEKEETKQAGNESGGEPAPHDRNVRPRIEVERPAAGAVSPEDVTRSQVPGMAVASHPDCSRLGM